MVIKIIKIYRQIVRQNVSAEMQYRTHFVISSLIQILWAFSRIAFYVVTFEHVVRVGDWTIEKTILLSSIFLFIQSISKLLFQESFMYFPDLIYRGELDYILLKPISTQFLATFKQFRIQSLFRLILSLCLLVLSVYWIGWQFNFFTMIAFIWSILISLIIIYSLHFGTVCLSFWLGYVDNIGFLPRVLTNNATYPLDIFPKLINEILLFVLPLAFIAMIPAKILFDSNIKILILGSLIAGTFFLLSRFIWKQGLKSYSSVSS